MIGSVGGWETIACATTYRVNICFSGYKVAAGAYTLHRGFYKAGTGKIGKAGSQSQEHNNDCAGFFISPKAKTYYKNIEWYPKLRVTQIGHYPVKKHISHIMVNEVEQMPVKL